MSVFKRATTSIIRRPGKTIILLLIVFILGMVIAGSIAVEGVISNTDANLRRRMQPIVTIGEDIHAYQEWLTEEDFDFDAIEWDNPLIRPLAVDPPLTSEHIHAIGELEYVSFYNYMIMYSLASFDLRRRGTEDFGQERMPHWFNLRGTSNTELVKIEEGIIDLTQGRQFETLELIQGAEPTAAIVSETFASDNNLSIGSHFELYEIITLPTDPNEHRMMWISEMFADERIYAMVDMEFEVIGLYDIPLDPEASQDDQVYWDRTWNLGNIYVPNWALEAVNRRVVAGYISSWDAVDYERPSWAVHAENEENPLRILPIFVLENPAYIDDFKEAATPLLPSEFHIFEDLSSEFEHVASSMETMQNIADWTLYISIVATLLILSLLITLFLRDRRYEMGVYLALGEKKGRIICQILIEVVATSFIGITLAVFAGSLISGIISQNLLENELIAQAEQNSNIEIMGGISSALDEIGIITTDLSPEEIMAAFEVSLSIETISLFYAIGLVTVMLSTLIAVLYVVRLNPKKVLL